MPRISYEGIRSKLLLLNLKRFAILEKGGYNCPTPDLSPLCGPRKPKLDGALLEEAEREDTRSMNDDEFFPYLPRTVRGSSLQSDESLSSSARNRCQAVRQLEKITSYRHRGRGNRRYLCVLRCGAQAPAKRKHFFHG